MLVFEGLDKYAFDIIYKNFQVTLYNTKKNSWQQRKTIQLLHYHKEMIYSRMMW